MFLREEEKWVHSFQVLSKVSPRFQVCVKSIYVPQTADTIVSLDKLPDGKILCFFFGTHREKVICWAKQSPYPWDKLERSVSFIFDSKTGTM